MNIQKANDELRSLGYILIRLTGCPKHSIDISIQKLPVKAHDYIGMIDADTTYADSVEMKLEQLMPNKPLMIVNDYCKSLRQMIKDNQKELKKIKRNLND